MRERLPELHQLGALLWGVRVEAWEVEARTAKDALEVLDALRAVAPRADVCATALSNSQDSS